MHTLFSFGPLERLTVNCEFHSCVHAHRYIHVQDINEECVVLEEVVSLEPAAVTDPKIRKKFVVVACEEKE